MRVSTLVSALTALTISVAVAAPAGLDRNAVNNAANELAARQYSPVPDTLSTTLVAVGAVQTSLDVAIKGLVTANIKSVLTSVTSLLNNAVVGVQADAGLTLAALLGVATYEQGIVKAYADIIIKIYNYLKPLVDIALTGLVPIKSEIALVTKALADLDAALKFVIGPVQPSFIADVLAVVAADLKVTVSAVLLVLAQADIKNILIV